jgi:hypothetical protein
MEPIQIRKKDSFFKADPEILPIAIGAPDNNRTFFIL